MITCTHLDTITVRDLPESVDGCEDCLRRPSGTVTRRLAPDRLGEVELVVGSVVRRVASSLG